MNHQPDSSADTSLVVLIPVYNDWGALALVVDALDRCGAPPDWKLHILIVDDGSDEADFPDDLFAPRHSIISVDVLALRRNLGHQRAIAVGLAWLEANMPCAAVVVMDGDGEDAPSDVPRLMARFEETGRTKIVFAARQRRSEGVTFQIFYQLYRLAHRILTGIPVRVGNFSVVPWPLLRRLVVVSDLWNHYAAAVFKARLPMTTIPTQRAHRLMGHPTMNFTALVMHGLSAMSVLGDRIGVRLSIAVGGLFVISMIGVAGLVGSGMVAAAGFSQGLFVAVTLIVVFAIQLVLGVTLFAFGVLGRRDTASFLPLRDYHYFVDRRTTLWTHDGG
ncbi:MAG: glycosyltransferase [Myxococcales bacterium]|nr:MAG: glycosyltransferase [Myxococcales bacterium]